MPKYHVISEKGKKKKPTTKTEVCHNDFLKSSVQPSKSQEKIKIIDQIILSSSEKEQIQETLNFSSCSTPKNGKQSSMLENIYETYHNKINKKCHSIKADEKLDESLYAEFLVKCSNEDYSDILKKRQNLQIFKAKDALLDMINENQVVVITGETGCGKTTQVGQLILDSYIQMKKGSQCRILCTQTTRISAITNAKRVASERCEDLRQSVGYSVRFEQAWPRYRGSLCFCTLGIVLKIMESDIFLNSVSHLIIDEVHKRTVECDILMAAIKRVITKRKDFRVVLMSATMNSKKISTFFDNAPCFNIPGTLFPVTKYYLEDVLEKTGFAYSQIKGKAKNKSLRTTRIEYDSFIEPYIRKLENKNKYSENVRSQLSNPRCEEINLNLILQLLIFICKTDKENTSILIFLPGFSEISALKNLILQSDSFSLTKYVIAVLHSQMEIVDQNEIFNPAKKKRKIILSTNIAESSITIDHVAYVIDCGKMKLKNFSIDKDSEILKSQWVSKANVIQRRGRAGRVRSGVCFHLFSKARKQELKKEHSPEILRSRLEEAILTVKNLQLGKIGEFFEQLLDKPSPRAVTFALNLLQRLNVLTEDENFTLLGYHLAQLSMAPQLAKMVIFGVIFSCLDPILTIAATLHYRDPFLLPVGLEEEVMSKRLELANDFKSDHLLMVEVLKKFEESGDENFCKNYFLSPYTLKNIQRLKTNFMKNLQDINFVPNLDPKTPECNRNANNLNLIKAVICAGLYPNICVAKYYENKCRVSQQSFKLSLHYSRLKDCLDTFSNCPHFVIFRKSGRIPIFTPDMQQKFDIHPKSILSECDNYDHNMLVYYWKVFSNCCYIHDASLIPPIPVVLFGDNLDVVVQDGKHIISINDNLGFMCDEDIASIIKQLREKFNSFLEFKISHSEIPVWQDQNATGILKTIIQLIASQ